MNKILRLDEVGYWSEIKLDIVRECAQAYSRILSTQQFSEAFRDRLHKVAGFAYVPSSIPMRNSSGAVIYYLYFASPNKTGAKKIGRAHV